MPSIFCSEMLNICQWSQKNKQPSNLQTSFLKNSKLYFLFEIPKVDFYVFGIFIILHFGIIHISTVWGHTLGSLIFLKIGLPRRRLCGPSSRPMDGCHAVERSPCTKAGPSTGGVLGSHSSGRGARLIPKRRFAQNHFEHTRKEVRPKRRFARTGGSFPPQMEIMFFNQNSISRNGTY